MLSVIKPFEINTSRGNLFFKELKPKDSKSTNQVHNLAKFLINNFIDSSIDPDWNELQNLANKDYYKNVIEDYETFIKAILKNNYGKSTILVAKDTKKHIKASIITFEFNEFKGIEDPKTLYLHSMAVDKEYRKNNIGKILIDKAIEKDKETFTDVFLTAYNNALPFYKKLGFEQLDTTNPKIKIISDKIQETRTDFPQYVTFMSKTLDKNATRWWERISL